MIALVAFACRSPDPVDREHRAPPDPVDSYQGGWPINPDKDALGDPPWDTVAAEGVQVPRFVGEDQFGEPVDLYDLAGHRVPVVLDISAGWCDPCRELAGWLAGEASPTYDADPSWSNVRDRIADGDVLWATILFEDADSRPADAAFSAEWAEAFDDPAIPVLADPDRQLTDWLFPAAYPNLHLADDAMVLQVYDPFGYERVLDALTR